MTGTLPQVVLRSQYQRTRTSLGKQSEDVKSLQLFRNSYSGVFRRLSHCDGGYFFTVKTSKRNLLALDRPDAGGFFTLCLVIVGVGQLIMILVQLSLFRVQLKYIRDSVERAYVFPELANIQPTVQGGVSLNLEVPNYGKTPAFIDEILGGFGNAMPSSNDEGFTDMLRFNPGAIVASDKAPYVVPHVFETQTGAPVYFYGYIYYRDVFGNSHETRFCKFVNIGPPISLTAGRAALNNWT